MLEAALPTFPEFDADDFDEFEGDLEAQEQRDARGRLPGDEKLQVRFFKKSVKDRPNSMLKGRMIYVDKDHIEIIVPGRRDNVVEEQVNKQHKKRFKADWERYVAGASLAHSGTPLDLWHGVTPAQIAELKHYNAHTVEDVATMAESTGSNFMGFHELQRKARAFVDANKEGEDSRKLEAALEARDAQIAALQAQMAEIIAANKKASEEKVKTK